MTTIAEADIDAIIADESKTIDGDISWLSRPTMTPAVEFRVDVESDGDYPLTLNGWFNPATGKLSFALIVQGVGRVYGLDLGAQHRNPDGERVGETHKNRWKDGMRDKYAYSPPDITAEWLDPVEVWQQFCREARLRHNGTMSLPVVQGVMVP